MFYWAPYNYSTYFKQSKGHCPFSFPGIFLDLGLRLLLSFQLVFLSFHDLSCAHGWISWNLWLPWETLLIWEREGAENKTLTQGELQGCAGRGILWLALPLSPPLLRKPATVSHLIPGGPDPTQACLAERLHLYSQLVHLFSANFAVTLQTDQCCDLLPAGWWEPPLALPIFKQLKLFCIS